MGSEIRGAAEGGLGDEELNQERDTLAGAGDAVALASALVATPSVNPALELNGPGEAAVAALAAGWLDTWGFATHVIEVAPGRCNVVARLRGIRPGPALILNGHLDTVGVDGMTVPPFGGGVEDGRLIGRGSCDMKGGVAAALSAAAALGRDGVPSGELVVALTADEEHASLGMAAFVEDLSRPRGGSDAQNAVAVVCEPTGLAVMPAHKGFVWLDFTFRGRAAHGSLPSEGIDAIRHAGLYIAALEQHGEELAAGPIHPLVGPRSFHVGTIEGGSAPSVYPAECRLNIERRTLPGESLGVVEAEFRDVLERLRGKVPELDVDLELGLDRPGTEVPKESPLVQGLLAAVERAGIEPKVEGMTAWVDAAFLNEAGVPAVCFGPGQTAQAHTSDEWCSIDEIETCARVLEDFARKFLTGPARQQ